jgi:predicted GNAT family acetyltransferase
VFTGGAPVSFCYARAVTETLWEVGLATLEAYRRRGLATKALRCMAASMAGRHAWPAWLVEDDDVASRQLAAKLGFVPSGRLALFRPA